MTLHARHIRYDYVKAFIDTLVNQGVRHMVFSPGSRSTPLLLHAANNPAVKLWRHIDERSAGFFALGIGKQLQEPVALICTSGTAAANFFPAIIEAKYGRVPLIVLTADRPHEARDNASPQEINQIKLYGDHVKWFAEMPVENGNLMRLDHAIQQATRASTLSREGPAGPVHLNFPFQEPLIPCDPLDEGLDDPATSFDTVQSVPTVFSGRASPSPSSCGPVFDLMLSTPKGLIICGPQDDPDLPQALLSVAKSLGFPILADPLSRLRTGHDSTEFIIDTYDTLFSDADFPQRFRPDLILRFGGTSASKPLNQWIASFDGPHIYVDPYEWRDPHFRATHMVRTDPVAFCETWIQQSVASSRPKNDAVAANPWLDKWMQANELCRESINTSVTSIPPFFEGRVFLELSRILPDHTTLYVGNSMPIRDADTFFPSVKKPIHIVANRGANGIDGVLSSALGAKAVSRDPLCLVIGDLSFYHDLGALLMAKQYDINITIVLINNDGGGIFSFLPQADLKDEFEHLFGTPHGFDFGPLMKAYDVRYTKAEDWDHFSAALQDSFDPDMKGIHLIEVQTDRERNVVLHKKVKNIDRLMQIKGEKLVER